MQQYVLHPKALILSLAVIVEHSTEWQQLLQYNLAVCVVFSCFTEGYGWKPSISGLNCDVQILQQIQQIHY